MPRTIQIFLQDGNPNGVKIIETSNRIIKAFFIPRIKLAEIKDREELNQPAIYFLCEKEGQKVYIGESESFYDRVKNHDQRKDFWEVAIAFVAKDNSLEKGDVKYLESLCIERGKDADRYEIENGVAPKRNNIHEFKLPILEEFYEDIKLLISTLGYPVFDKIDTQNIDEDDVWYCKNKNTEARGIYDERGFTILEGSIIDSVSRFSFVKNYPAQEENRQSLLKKHGENFEGNLYKLKQNITFSSPNQAGAFSVGGTVNAWITWKDKEGRTMDEAIRN